MIEPELIDKMIGAISESNFSERRLDRALSHVCTHWFPINSEVLTRVKAGLESSAYDLDLGESAQADRGEGGPAVPVCDPAAIEWCLPVPRAGGGPALKLRAGLRGSADTRFDPLPSVFPFCGPVAGDWGCDHEMSRKSGLRGVGAAFSFSPPWAGLVAQW